MSDFKFDDTLGAAYIGVVVAAGLHGVSCIQTWYYFNHQKDSWALKSMVTAVMVFDTIHQILISHTVYTYVITSFGNPARLNDLVWSLIVEVLFNGLTAFVVQSFLAMRVWRLSNRNVGLLAAVLLIVFGEFGCIIAYFFLAMRLHTIAELAKIKGLSIAVNALAAGGDVLIAVTLCYLLHRSRTGFQRSDTIITKLILFTVNTGVLTSLCAVASLISITVAGETFWYIAFFFCLGRLYTNSLLATLNARKRIRNAGSKEHSSDRYSLSLRDIPKSASMASKRPANISININTTKEFVTDSDLGHSGEKGDLDLTDSTIGTFKESEPA